MIRILKYLLGCLILIGIIGVSQGEVALADSMVKSNAGITFVGDNPCRKDPKDPKDPKNPKNPKESNGKKNVRDNDDSKDIKISKDKAGRFPQTNESKRRLQLTLLGIGIVGMTWLIYIKRSGKNEKN